MPVPKLKSKEYLEFIHWQSCIVCGSHSIEAHHESILRKFSGSRKKDCDYTALPLCSDHHYERHANGRLNFWKDYDINYVEKSANFLRKYKEQLEVRTFSSEESYLEELEVVDAILSVIAP